MGLFSRKSKEPTYAQTVAAYGEQKPVAQDYEPSSNIHHLYVFDENTLNRLLEHPRLRDAAPAFGPTCDTNFLDKQGVEILQIKNSKAFKYLQLNMPRSERREFLPYIKFLEANSYARACNNREGSKIKTLTTVTKVIRTGEAEKRG